MAGSSSKDVKRVVLHHWCYTTGVATILAMMRMATRNFGLTPMTNLERADVCVELRRK